MDGKGNLKIDFADVKGGQATLFVTPLGESLPVDTGWTGFVGRDADRIVALCWQAEVSRIDNALAAKFRLGGMTERRSRPGRVSRRDRASSGICLMITGARLCI
jgi:hypothetical protein